MKRIYFRPSGAALPALGLLAALALVFAAAVEIEPCFRGRELRATMHRSAERAGAAFDFLKARRPGGVAGPRHDPAQSGLIGVWMSPVTSVYGNLQAKQTSANPNFAALVARMLAQAGIRPGDTVAVGLSGSFPALNVCAITACEESGAVPVIVSGAASSQWGANQPDWMWPDMEAALFQAGLLAHRSSAASIGGASDGGLSLDPEGRRLAREAITRNNLHVIEEPTLDKAVQARMEIYLAHGRKPRAYINVGGSSASVGSPADKRLPDPGLNLEPPEPADFAQDSVMRRFSEAGVPIIHISDLKELAQREGLPWAPRETPAPGSGAPFDSRERNRPLAGVLLAILAALALRLRKAAARG